MIDDMKDLEHPKIVYPLDVAYLQRRQKKLRRILKENVSGPSFRVAILGGSTTNDIANYIELFLLNEGVNVEIYQSDYNQYYQEAIFENQALKEFNPKIIYIHTSSMNITQWPSPSDNEAQVNTKLEEQYNYFEAIWSALAEQYQATIIQNNFELPFVRPLGNFDGSATIGKTHFTLALNEKFSAYARNHANFILHDLHYLASWFGLERWYKKSEWYSYKYAMNSDAFPELGYSVTNQIKATLGLSKKAIVCDLDNTLWGGVIGDDGLSGIQIGNENAESQVYTDLQSYLKELHQRGILLTVCSKNDSDNAKSGFLHTDSVLNLDDFSEFVANWENKDSNIEQIAMSLNIGVDSLVFLDDNPSERELVSKNLPLVSVPDLGVDITQYINILDKAGLFELVSLNREDTQRAQMYANNQARNQLQKEHENYDDYLHSLKMEALIRPFDEQSLPRITQLANKTNQFNLTTQRYSMQEMTGFMKSDSHIALYARLKDKFGDNGIVSVILGEERENAVFITLWLMSCRVFKRQLEWAMFSELIRYADERNADKLIGKYIPSKKNFLVRELYKELGFTCISEDENGITHWELLLDGHTISSDTPISITR